MDEITLEAWLVALLAIAAVLNALEPAIRWIGRIRREVSVFGRMYRMLRGQWPLEIYVEESELSASKMDTGGVEIRASIGLVPHSGPCMVRDLRIFDEKDPKGKFRAESSMEYAQEAQDQWENGFLLERADKYRATFRVSEQIETFRFEVTVAGKPRRSRRFTLSELIK